MRRTLAAIGVVVVGGALTAVSSIKVRGANALAVEPANPMTRAVHL